MKPTIPHLRKICQSEKSSQPKWYLLHRKLSIYFTWCFLKLGVSANSVTVLSIISGILGSLLLLWLHSYYVIISFFLLYLYFLFDKVDGEIARATKKSFYGIYVDELGHLLVYPLFFLCFGYLITTSGNYPITAIICAFLVILIRYMQSLVFTIYSKKMYADITLAKLFTHASKATSLKASSSYIIIKRLISVTEFLKEYSTAIFLFFIAYIYNLYSNINMVPGLFIFYSGLFLSIFLTQIFLNYSNLNNYLAEIHSHLKKK